MEEWSIHSDSPADHDQPKHGPVDPINEPR